MNLGTELAAILARRELQAIRDERREKRERRRVRVRRKNAEGLIDGGLADQVLTYLRLVGPTNAPSVAEALGIERKQANGALKRLCNAGRAERTRIGVYIAVRQ